MTRWIALAMLFVGVALAGASGSMLGTDHTAYRTAFGVVQELETIPGELAQCEGRETPAEREACADEAIDLRVESGALQDGQAVEDAIAVAEARADTVGLPMPGERFLQWAGRGGIGWLLGCALIVAGAVIARRQQAAEAAGDSDATEERVHFPAAVLQLRHALDELAEEIADLAMDDDAPEVREQLENLEADLILPVVDARGQFIARHGIGGFAEYFSPFSAGERNLHRTWSALTDGHAVVAREALDLARQALAAASNAWDAVEIRAGGHAWEAERQPVAAVGGGHEPEPTDEAPLAARAAMGAADMHGEDVEDDDTVGSEQPLVDSERDTLHARAERGLACLDACGVAPGDDTPDALVDAIRSAVDRYRAGDAPAGEWSDTGDAAAALGALWGSQVEAAAGWLWVRLDAGGRSGVALVSPDRAHAVFPEDFLRAVIEEAERDNTVRLVFTMIRDAKVPDAPPGSRTVLS